MDIKTLKRSAVKMESFLVDVNELLLDEDLDTNTRTDLNSMADVGSAILARIINMVKRETGQEEDYLNDTDRFDDTDYDEYPSLDNDDSLMDMELE